MIFKPYEYQERAIRWVLDHPRCGLFLDMGLGKSVITLTAIRRLIDDAEISTALVVAPKKVAESTWTDEASKWNHLKGLRVSPVIGGAAQRLSALKEKADVYVISRDNIAWLLGLVSNKRPIFDMLVLDELTSFKNSQAMRFKAVKALRTETQRVVGLTGTPAPNGLADLWAEMYCIDGGERLGKSVTRFREAYFNAVVWNGITIKLNPKKDTEAALRGKIRDICISMTAKDYLSLPGLRIVRRMVALPPSVAAAYEQFEHDRVMEVAQQEATADIFASSAAALMTKLSQFANGNVYDENGAAWPVHSEKLAALEELVEGAGEPVLVFYQYRSDRDRFMAALSKRYRVESYEDAGTLRRWNDGKIDVLFAHPASTAFGLNMQAGGRYIVWLGTGWNLELFQQANARLHRQGQTKPVTAFLLLTEGTVDTRMADIIQNKENAQKALIDGLCALIEKHSK